MADALAGVACALCTCLCRGAGAICQNPENIKDCLCCACGLVSKCCNSDCERCAGRCCDGCCQVLKCCAHCCSSSDTGFVYLHCGHCSLDLSVAAVAGVIVAVYCAVVGVVAIITAYKFGDNQCDSPIDAHVIVQGLGMLGNALVLLYVLRHYYFPKNITFPFPERVVFSRFHGLFLKDRALATLLGTVSLGFWWSLLGYYWLSLVECEAEDEFLLTMASYTIGNEFILVLFFLVLVYSILSIAACDEGSCRIEELNLDCFLCCCECCLKTPANFHQRRESMSRAARGQYPAHRNKCVDFAMESVMLCGCIRHKYVRERPELPVPDRPLYSDEINLSMIEPSPAPVPVFTASIYPPTLTPRAPTLGNNDYS